jgi:hypothetical protein
MKNYKGILFKVGDNGPVSNSTQWGCYVTGSPYIPTATKPKNIVSQSWYDENGDDEYIPEVLYYEPIEATLNFVYKGTVAEAKTQITAFISYLRSGEFSFYDEFYKVGRQKSRLLDFSDEAMWLYDDIEAQTGIAQFSIRVKINDPVTDVVL